MYMCTVKNRLNVEHLSVGTDVYMYILLFIYKLYRNYKLQIPIQTDCKLDVLNGQ